MTVSSRGKSITAGGDPRITRTGRVLRNFKLDELPQIWNVLCGDMNFIGPRPEVPEFVDLSDMRWQTVLSYRPGITDLASLLFRHEERFLAGREDVEEFYRNWLLPRKLDISAHYAKTRSPLKDIRLLALTLKHVLARSECNEHEIARQFSYGGPNTWTK